MPGSSVSSTVTLGITLGQGNYLTPLSIASTGKIVAPGYGIDIVDFVQGTVVNSGTVIGSNGVFLKKSAAAIVNQGFIGGTNTAIDVFNFNSGEALIINSGTLTGHRGISGVDANVTNSGYIYGSVAGIDLQLSTITNSGTIVGQAGIYSGDGTLSNHGAVQGSEIGVTIAGGEALNFGSISSNLGIGAAVNDLAGSSATLAGSLINYGSISGGVYGVYASGSFTNDGAVSGLIGLCVGIGGAARNSTAIYGSAYGAELSGLANMLGGASLINSGSIIGGEIGVTLGIRGSLTNSGYIYGQNIGVAVYKASLTNSGSIVSADIGVKLASGVMNNLKSGAINAASFGIQEFGGSLTNYGTVYGATAGGSITSGSLANFGVITGATYGVGDYGANVTNYGLIAGPSYGMKVSRANVSNGGTISGGLDAIAGSFITLTVDPGAVFIGKVVDENGKGLLKLAGAGLGSLGGIGSQIAGFKEISFAAGPQWSIEGNESGLTSVDTVSILGFAEGDTIVLDGFSASSDLYIKNTGLELSGGGNTVTLDIAGNFSTSSFLVTESANQTTIANVTCFARGTHIATPCGEVTVESLKIGQLVRTLHGGARPVKWIGSRFYDGRFIRGNAAILPIRIKAGAIADGVPARDLRVSPGHAISIDDVLVHAKRLVNGVSVVQEDSVEEVAYFHVELEDHEILLAEMCPAESFIGEDFRAQFQNAAEYARLYPGHIGPQVMCQPRLDSGFPLYAIQRRLRARAGLKEILRTGPLRGYIDQAGPEICFGWAQDEAARQTPVSLDILSRGRRIGRVLANLYRQDVADAGYGDGYQGFEFALPAGIAGAIEVRRSVDGALLAMAAGTTRKQRAA